MNQPRQTDHFYLTVLFLREGDFFVAQALEYDLAAQGSSIDNAKRAFEQAFIGHILLDQRMKRAPLSGLSRAPEKFWNIFKTFIERHPGPLKAEAVETPAAMSGMPPAFMISAMPDSINHSAQS